VVLLEALVAILRLTFGRVINALFGWASAALFGDVPKSRKIYVSLAIGLAAAWPLLLVGIAFPKLAALLIAFVPLSDRVREGVVRAVWIALALLVPLGVGWAMSRFSRKEARVLAGYPITLGLSAAFLAACVVVPIQKISALFARRKFELVPLVVPSRSLQEVGKELRAALDAGGLKLRPAETPFSARVLTGIARSLGGPALGRHFMDTPPHLQGPRLDMTLYPHGVRLLGAAGEISRAHALISETAVWTRALETMTPQAQKIERRIKRVARAIRRPGSRARARSLGKELLDAIADSPLEYSDWAILHRQALQVSLAESGEATPIERAAREPVAEAVPAR
jgi:hypothetical protein